MMKFDEKKLLQSGYLKLQEKENMVYYEKMNDEAQIFVIYDKSNQKIKSVDSYSFDEYEMKVRPSETLKNEIHHLLNIS